MASHLAMLTSMNAYFVGVDGRGLPVLTDDPNHAWRFDSREEAILVLLDALRSGVSAAKEASEHPSVMEWPEWIASTCRMDGSPRKGFTWTFDEAKAREAICARDALLDADLGAVCELAFARVDGRWLAGDPEIWARGFHSTSPTLCGAAPFASAAEARARCEALGLGSFRIATFQLSPGAVEPSPGAASDPAMDELAARMEAKALEGAAAPSSPAAPGAQGPRL